MVGLLGEESGLSEIKTHESLLQELKTDNEALMLRKVARKMHADNPQLPVIKSLVEIMGDDPEPLPKTPTFVDYSNFNTRAPRGRGRGRGNMRGRGRVTPIRGRRYPAQGSAWRETRPKVTIEHKPLPEGAAPKHERPDDMMNLKKPNNRDVPPARESMQDFFKDIETLPDSERNRMIQVCIKELIEENKLLRDANRRLVQKHRSFPGSSPSSNSKPEKKEFKDFKPEKPKTEAELAQLEKDVRSISLNGKKPMNAHAPEFEMKSKSSAAIAPLPHELYKQQLDPENMRYEDYVRMRRAEQERHQYEEMVAEQMYLEELEMRHMREAEMYGGFDERYSDPRFYDERAAAAYDPRLADPRMYDEYAYHY